MAVVAQTSSPDRTRYRPAPGGSSIGILGGQPGTLGCLVLDNTDDSLQILTTAGVVTHGGVESIGTPVYQPAPGIFGDPSDQIGTVTRALSLNVYPALYPVPSNATPTLDAAIVAPLDASLVVDQTLDAKIPSASRLHPMVGIITSADVGYDGAFYYVALALDKLLAALDCRPLHPSSIIEPRVGQAVSFVGAGGGTRHGRIERIDLSLTMRYAHPNGPAVGKAANALLIRAGVSEEEDAGAVLLTWAGNPVESRCSGCAIATDLERTYGVPFTQNVDLADAIRDRYLLPTSTGNMLVQLFYKNEEQFRSRMAAISPTQAELDYARLIYDRYVDLVRNEIDGVAMTYVPVTAQIIDDARAAVYGLSRFMTAPEYDACQALLDLLEDLKGYTMQEAIDYVNLQSTVSRVHAILESVPGWDTSYDSSKNNPSQR